MQDDSAIKQGVSELEGYLRTNQITIGLLAYISKVLLALSRARDYVFQEDALNALEEIYQSLGPILEICGVVAAVIAVFPAAAPLVAIFLAALDIGVTAVFGFKGIKGFFDFFGEIGEAQTEAEIDQAARDLADGLENTIGFAIGVAGLFKSLKTLATEGQKLFKAGQELVELFKTGITKLPAFGKVLLKFGANGTFLASVAEAVLNVGKGGIQQLWEVIVQLGQNDKVFNLLAELADAKENRLLDDVLKIGTKAIDDLAAILDTGATAEQIVKLRFEVEGMSIEKLKDLLTKWQGMTPEILTNLFFDASGKLRAGMSIETLQALLAKCEDPELLAELLGKASIPDILEMLNTVPAAALKELLGQMSITELRDFLPAINRVGLSPQDLLKILEEAKQTREIGVPIGIPKDLFDRASQTAREILDEMSYGKDIVVQSSRVRGYSLEPENGVLKPVFKGVPPVGSGTDIDVAVRVPQEVFDEAIQRSFGTPTPGTAKERTMQQAIEQERIFGGDARPNLRTLRREIANSLGVSEDKVQVTLVKEGGKFDSNPTIPMSVGDN